MVMWQPYSGAGPRPAFHDRSWPRKALASWDERWERLSLPARQAFADHVPTPARAGGKTQTATATRFAPAVLNELVSEGFVVLENVRDKQQARMADAASPFGIRLRTLRRAQLLRNTPESNLNYYINTIFDHYGLTTVLGEVVKKATGTEAHRWSEDPLGILSRRGRWPAWVAQFLGDPLAESILAAIEAAGGTMPIGEVTKHVSGAKPVPVRSMLDDLVNHLALVEDVDATSFRILVGFLPAVFADLKLLRHRPTAETLKPQTPAQIASEGGVDVPDLRAFLLELAAQPARLRQNHTLYQKEAERLEPALPTLPDWLLSRIGQQQEQRLERALHWARRLSFVHQAHGVGDALQVELTQAGQSWLTSNVVAQYAAVYRNIRNNESNEWMGNDDYHFLNSRITAVPKASEKAAYHWFNAKERYHLRESAHRALASLPLGQFFRLDQVCKALSVGPGNPLLLGRKKEQVVIRQYDRMILPLDEVLESVGNQLLRDLLARLAWLGAVQMGLDSQGELLVARLPRLDLYFGNPMAEEPTPVDHTQVVVQPDFTVMVIGLNPTPAAELMPFCDRVQGSVGGGSLTLRLTRDAVLRGLAQGLTAEAMIERLERLASKAVPANVVTQVRTWGGWMRKVSLRSALLLSCPDEETALRAIGALGKKAERVGPTVVAVEEGALTPAVRQKLQQNGLMIEGKGTRKKK